MSNVRWMPLESNPEVMNTFMWKLGISKKFQFNDVFGLDSELLCMIPQPCFAIILLFPVTEKYEDFREKEAKLIEQNGQKISSDVFFMKQTIGNACGTIGVIHAVANNKHRIKIDPGSVFERFLTECAALSPDEIGKHLENDTGISEIHEECAQEGQSAAIDAEQHVDLHFVALVHVNGSLYELDGRKTAPINHGDTMPDTFLEDAAIVCQKFMARDQSEVRFTIVALSEI